MNTEPIKHETFIVERTYPADAARIFRAFSDTDVKRRWFAEGEDWRVEEFTADFRPAGYETSRFRYADGPPITYDTRYLDIITDGRPSSVSLASVELFPAQGGTRLVYTEQGQYFDGGDQALQREIGCGELYDTLGEVLTSAH